MAGGSETTTEGETPPRWRAGGVFLVLVGVLLAAGALSAFVVRQAQVLSAAGDQRAFQRLAIAAHGLAGWPQVAQAIAARSLFWQTDAPGKIPDYSFDHPRFGRVPLRYSECAATDPARPVTPAFQLENGVIILSGPSITADPVEGERARASVRALDAAGNSLRNRQVCYTLGPIPLARALLVPEGFLSILVVREEFGEKGVSETLVGQVGIETLPIRSLSEVPDLSTERAKRQEAAVKAVSGAAGVDARLAESFQALVASGGDTDVLAPVERVIAGKAYRLHPYRIDIPQAGAEPIRLVLVGATPARSALDVADLKGARLLALGLAVAALLALAPFARLAFLGPVDALRPLEVATLALALVLLAALATALGVLAVDVLRTTARADAVLARDAGTLATRIHGDLAAATAHGKSIAAAAQSLPEPALRRGEPPTIVARLDWTQLAPTQIPVPESLFAIDARGRQLAGTRAVGSARRLSGLLPFADRAYFRRALVGDVRPETKAHAEQVVGAIGASGAAGFVVEHVLARDDGIPKAALALPVPEKSSLHARGARVLLMGFVIESMLAPTGLGPETRYAVFDRSLPGWPVIFHSDPGRAHAELLQLSLAEADVPRIEAALSRLEPAAARRCREGPGPIAAGGGFWAPYVGTAQRMVALPVPCTDWAVLAFEPRAMLEAQASQPTETALVIWLGIATFAGGLALAAGFAGASLGTPVWQAFWPDPAQGALYPRLALAGLAASALLTAAVFAAPLASRATILLSLLAAAAIVGTLVSQHRRIAATDPAGGRDPLGGRARASYLAVAGALLALLAAVPMLALAADARALDRMREAGAVAVRGIESENAANRARVLIRNNLFADRPQPLPAPVAVPSCIAASGGSLVADLVALAGEPVCVVPGGTPLPDVELGCYGRWVALLAGAGALLLPLAGLFGVARNLFGFGVPLEAIEYPRLAEAGARGGAGPPYDEAAAPERAILVAGPDPFRHRLERYARLEIDLYESRDWEALVKKLPTAAPAGRPRPLVLVHNLELLLRSEKERREALRLLEELVREQKRREVGDDRAGFRHFRLLLLADISPLDRFLQATEYRSSGGASALTDPAESIRWTRLLEGFTTYTARVRPRPMPPGIASEPRGLRHLLVEVAYLPDRVVEALLPDSTPPLMPEEILAWGRPFLATAEPAAVSDFLASQLIEHYHYLWSISSRAEQILIHRLASGEVPGVRPAYALRSLVRRGIVVLDPAPRLMSRSFARFVRQVERPERLSLWAKDAPRGAWQRMRGNLTLVLPLLIVLVAVVVLRGAGGIEASLPLLLAAGPALLNMLAGRGRTA